MIATLPKLNVLITLLVIMGFVESQKPLNFTELTELHGYEAEEHTVVTEDGYVLSVFRITKGAKCKENNKQTPVFYMPPLLAAADSALEAGPDAGVPYLISDACFDTWVGNSRGTHYGRKHVLLDPDKNKEFWEFSVDEIGSYDAPAMVEYVLKYTKADQLMYIGFSQGGGSFFVMCSERPDVCQRIKMMIGLAPATRHWNTKSVFFRTLVENVEDNLDLLNHLNIWEIMGQNKVTETLTKVCQNNPRLCEWLLSIVDSSHPRSVATSTLENIFERFPSGTSVQNLVRYSQSCRSQKFVKFCYGIEKNLRIYGRANPPEYNLAAANLPILLMVGRNDAIVDVKDVKWLASKLPNVIEMVIVKDPQWNHADMYYSQFIKKTIFPKMLDYLLHYDEM